MSIMMMVDKAMTHSNVKEKKERIIIYNLQRFSLLTVNVPSISLSVALFVQRQAIMGEESYIYSIQPS